MLQKEIVNLMGKLVVVETELRKKRVSTNEGCIIKQVHYKIPPRVGWVTGFRYLPQGEIHGSDYLEFVEDGDRIPCLLVAYWPTMKPVRVPLDAWRLAQPGERPVTTQYPWTDRDRAALRKEMASVPRDAKGRWLTTKKD